MELHNKRLDRLSNVLQVEWAKLYELEPQLLSNLFAHRTGHAHRARRALGLKPCRHVYTVTMHIGAINDYVANVDPNAEPDAAVGWSIAIMYGYLLLNIHGTAHCSLNAVEDYEDRVACSVDDAAAVLADQQGRSGCAVTPAPVPVCRYHPRR